MSECEPLSRPTWVLGVIPVTGALKPCWKSCNRLFGPFFPWIFLADFFSPLGYNCSNSRRACTENEPKRGFYPKHPNPSHPLILRNSTIVFICYCLYDILTRWKNGKFCGGGEKPERNCVLLASQGPPFPVLRKSCLPCCSGLPRFAVDCLQPSTASTEVVGIVQVRPGRDRSKARSDAPPNTAPATEDLGETREDGDASYG